MSYGRMLEKEWSLESEIQGWIAEGIREDEEESKEHGPGDDGWSLPPEFADKERRLETIRAAKERLEKIVREKAVEKGRDPETEKVPARAQTNSPTPNHGS